MLTPKTLGILAAIVAGAGYICKEGVDAVERTKSALGKELEAYKESSRHQSTQLNLLSQRMQLEIIQNRVSPSIDYRSLVLQDIVVLKQVQGLVREASEDLSRLIDKLIFGSASFKERRKAFQSTATVNDQTAPQAPSRELDWTDSAKIKLVVVSTIVAGIPELVFGDTVITTANRLMKFLGSVVQVGKWIVRIFYGIGACLGAYGVVKGIK